MRENNGGEEKTTLAGEVTFVNLNRHGKACPYHPRLSIVLKVQWAQRSGYPQQVQA
jgi:hypothetical protein